MRLFNPAAEPCHPYSIELYLTDPAQLFNSLDYSPLESRHLNHDIEDFIVGSAEEHPPETPLELHLHLEQWPPAQPAEQIQAAVRHYFTDRARLNDLQFSQLMKRGRVSLAIGMLFLVGCLLLRRLLFASAVGTWTVVAGESLTIAGWVAMWRPMEIYLYDWWPLRRRGRIFLNLSQMPVAVLEKGNR